MTIRIRITETPKIMSLIRLSALATLLLTTACSIDASRATAPRAAELMTSAIVSTNVPTLPCGACVFGPIVLVGRTAEVVRWQAQFKANGDADHLLDLEFIRPQGAAIEVHLNGAKVDLYSAIGQPGRTLSGVPATVLRLRRPVRLLTSNELTITYGGAEGAQVTIQVEAGVEPMGAAGGELTTSGGRLRLTVPAGALVQTLELQASPTTSTPGGIGIVPGTAFDLGPSGTTFALPATLSLAYDPAVLPQGIGESSLQLYHAGIAGWTPVIGSAVDPATHRVSAPIAHFSTYAVGFSASVATPAVLTLPIPPASRSSVGISQGYGGYGTYLAAKYHTGFDLAPTAGATDAVSAADGFIVLVQENDVVGRAANRCKFPVPSTGGSGCSDHGLGNTVIIQHGSVYTQYSHLASIDPRVLAACGARDPITRRARCASLTSFVAEGARIGNVGGSGYGVPNAWNRHLHFEVKRFDRLGIDPSGAFSDDCGPSSITSMGGCGYLASSPDASGYANPVLSLHPIVSTASPMRVSATATLRLGPGNVGGVTYPGIATLASGTMVQVVRTAGATSAPSCSFWVQAVFGPGGRVPYSSGGGYAEEGWLCGDLLSGGGPTPVLTATASVQNNDVLLDTPGATRLIPVSVALSGGTLTSSAPVQVEVFLSANRQVDQTSRLLWSSGPTDFPSATLNAFGAKTVTVPLVVPTGLLPTEFYSVIVSVNRNRAHQAQSKDWTLSTVVVFRYPLSQVPLGFPTGGLHPAAVFPLKESYFVSYGGRMAQGIPISLRQSSAMYDLASGTLSAAFAFFENQLVQQGFAITSRSLTSQQGVLYGQRGIADPLSATDWSVVVSSTGGPILAQVSYLTRFRR